MDQPQTPPPLTPEQTIAAWTERDLSQAASHGSLPPAFEVEETIRQIEEVLAAGQYPVLIGERGVGKSAVIYELIRRAQDSGTEENKLTGKQVLQMSIRRRAAALRSEDLLGEDTFRLVEALESCGENIIPFFKDFHLSYRFDLETHFLSLAFSFTNPAIFEGLERTVQSMFELSPELEEHFSLIRVSEPNTGRTRRILRSWASHTTEQLGRQIDEQALDEALHLSHRFQSRGLQPRKALELLRRVLVRISEGETLSSAEVISSFCDQFRVPRELVDPALPLDLNQLESQLADTLLGQEEAIRAVVQMIGLIKAGLTDMRKPFGTFFFVGPTGVGKTYLAQLLAEKLFGDKDRIIRINMADYQDDGSHLILYGDPQGRNYNEVRGVLSQRLFGFPFAVLLLDEFEKASRKVHDRFLQLIDEGEFINGAGETISCRSMILIATSNTGAEVYRSRSLGFTEVSNTAELKAEVDRRLRREFRFELLNRFDDLIHFYPLTRSDIREIAHREVMRLQDRIGMKQRGLHLDSDPSVIDWLAAYGYDPFYGARFLRRTIEREVSAAAADAIVRENPPADSVITLAVRGKRISASVETPASQDAATAQLPETSEHAESESLPTTPEALLLEAYSLLERNTARLEDLEQRREAISELLEQMNQPNFWKERRKAREAVDTCRELELSVRVEERFAGPIRRLQAFLDSIVSEPPDLKKLTEAYRWAQTADQRWANHLVHESAGKVWLLISDADPLGGGSEWILQLAEMELSWCARLGLLAEVAAYQIRGDSVQRVVLEVEGPGAQAYLQMEVGMHRMHYAQAADHRATIDIIPRDGEERIAGFQIRQAKQHHGLLGTKIAFRGNIEIEARGLQMEFLAEEGETLSEFLNDLTRAWEHIPGETAPVARHYGEDGTGARDPRTGAVVARAKEVQRGRLERLLEAYQKLPETAPKAD